MKKMLGRSKLLGGALLALALIAGLGYVALAQGGGTITVRFLHGADNPLGGPLTLEAVPPNGYEFDHWEMNGQDVGSDNPISINLDTDKGIHAVLVESAESTSVRVSKFEATGAAAAWYFLVGLALLAAAAIVSTAASPLGRGEVQLLAQPEDLHRCCNTFWGLYDDSISDDERVRTCTRDPQLVSGGDETRSKMIVQVIGEQETS
jgi:hypothetical protein